MMGSGFDHQMAGAMGGGHGMQENNEEAMMAKIIEESL
jgi:hypothetical protein